MPQDDLGGAEVAPHFGARGGALGSSVDSTPHSGIKYLEVFDILSKERKRAEGSSCESFAKWALASVLSVWGRFSAPVRSASARSLCWAATAPGTAYMRCAAAALSWCPAPLPWLGLAGGLGLGCERAFAAKVPSH